VLAASQAFGAAALGGVGGAVGATFSGMSECRSWRRGYWWGNSAR